MKNPYHKAMTAYADCIDDWLEKYIAGENKEKLEQERKKILEVGKLLEERMKI